VAQRFQPAERSEVIITRGLPDVVLPVRAGREMAAVISQVPVTAVADAVSDRLGAEVGEVIRLEVPDREAAKTLAVVGDLYNRLAEANLGRHDTVVAVGGGAVTDLGGFVAATWVRGVESVLVPTSVLGAVDAAIGGKTGINHAGKNLVGAFWHPSRVVVDLDVLEAAPLPLRLEGSAEIVKAGYIGDPEIVRLYRRHGGDTPLAEVVPRAVAVKVDVVRADFREGGGRAILNFGHTIGHGIETLSGMPHGFAVSIGMAAAGAVSAHRYGFDGGSLTELLFSLGLPVAAGGLSRQAVLDLIARDKKRTSAGVRMVLLRGVGDVVVDLVSPAELDLALAAVGIS
jgi:3-dehydroquinate synthetase